MQSPADRPSFDDIRQQLGRTLQLSSNESYNYLQTEHYDDDVDADVDVHDDNPNPDDQVYSL